MVAVSYSGWQKGVLGAECCNGSLTCRFELGDIPPKIEGVNVEPGGIPGADDVFLEFDFTW